MKKIIISLSIGLLAWASMHAMDGKTCIVPYNNEKHGEALKKLYTTTFFGWPPKALRASKDPDKEIINVLELPSCDTQKPDTFLGFIIHKTIRSSKASLINEEIIDYKGPTFTMTKICYLAVIPSERRTGHGRKLVKHIEELASSQKHDCVYLKSADDRNQLFYERLDYQPRCNKEKRVKLLSSNAFNLLNDGKTTKRVKQNDEQST